MGTTTQWPTVGYETLPWHRDPEELALVPKSRRRKILPTYEAAVPPHIAECKLELPHDLQGRLDELKISLVRFDATAPARTFDLPALLLRSESSSSSQIESLTSSARNVALAELSDKAPHNAQLISANIAAMRAALALSDDLDLESLLEVHRTLMGGHGGRLRNEQVWIGGTAYSPHGAAYVPPRTTLVPNCLDDLFRFARREDLDPIAKAAIVHAQFEEIHPFTDGNGRTGRTLLHKMLRREDILGSSTLPVSSGLLHDVDGYLDALDRYHAGEVGPIITRVADALEVALALGMRASSRIEDVLEGWRTSLTERTGAAIHQLPDLLVQHPVVNAQLVADELAITPRAANDLIDRAIDHGILRRVGTARRGVFYQADDLIDVLDDLASTDTLRRVVP